MNHSSTSSAIKQAGKSAAFSTSAALTLLVILSLAALVRISMFHSVYADFPERIISPDTVRYEKPAIGFLKNGTLRDSLPMNETQDVHVAPLYPMFIYSVYKVLGQDHKMLAYAQIMVSLLSILLLYLVTLNIWNRRAALAAAVLFAASPMQSLYASILLSETLFVFSVLVVCFCAVLLLKQYSVSPSLKLAVLLGLALGFSAMVRPISYYLVFLFVAALFVFHLTIRKHGLIQYLKTALLIFVAFVVVVGPWQIRNNEIAGAYLFTDNPGQIMLYWKASGMMAYRDGIDYAELRNEIKQSVPTDFESIAAKHEYEKRHGLDIILSDIPAYLKFSIHGLKKMLIGPGLKKFGNYFDGENAGIIEQGGSSTGVLGAIENKTGYSTWYIATIAYSICYLLLIYALFALGSIRYWQRGEHRILLVFCAALVAYFLLASTGHSAADSRMRVPAMPMLVFFAGIGLSLFSRGKHSVVKST